MKLKVVAHTLLKQLPVQSTDLTGDQKQPLRPDMTLDLIAYGQDQNHHLKITLAQPIGDRTTWYVYAPHVVVEGEQGSGLKVMAVADTVLKTKPLQSSELEAAEKVNLAANTELPIREYSAEEMNHYQIQLLEPLQGRSTWFVYTPHITLIDPNGQTVVVNRFNMGVPSDSGWSWPMKGTSCGPKCEFGYARGRLHAGVDIGGFTPDECYAASDGVVKTVKNDTSGAEGRAIYIERPDGWTHVYFHLQKIHVKPGQQVRRGDLIAIRGGSGNGGEGKEIDGKGHSIHLHFEIHDPSQGPVDPRTVLPDDDSCPIVG